jgi:hypothetical protein
MVANEARIKGQLHERRRVRPSDGRDSRHSTFPRKRSDASHLKRSVARSMPARTITAKLVRSASEKS